MHTAKKGYAVVLLLFTVLSLFAGCMAPQDSFPQTAEHPTGPALLAEQPTAELEKVANKGKYTAQNMQPTIDVKTVAATGVENEEPFSIVWMSDTQLYSESYPRVFQSMTAWTVENAAAKNIRYVIHTGDVVNDRTKPTQWKNAQEATRPLMDVLPFFVVAGNHDTGTKAPDYFEFAETVGPDTERGIRTISEVYKSGMARYDLFEVGVKRFIIAGIGYAHTQDAIDWVDRTLKEYADRTAILAFHSYLNTDETLTSHGQKFSEQLVECNPNVRLILSGHKHGVGNRSVALDDDGDGLFDRTVQAMLTDFQAEKEGGGGFVKILEFDPQKQEVTVETYSPYEDRFLSSEMDAFTFKMDF